VSIALLLYFCLCSSQGKVTGSEPWSVALRGEGTLEDQGWTARLRTRRERTLAQPRRPLTAVEDFSRSLADLTPTGYLGPREATLREGKGITVNRSGMRRAIQPDRCEDA